MRYPRSPNRRMFLGRRISHNWKDWKIIKNLVHKCFRVQLGKIDAWRFHLHYSIQSWDQHGRQHKVLFQNSEWIFITMNYIVVKLKWYWKDNLKGLGDVFYHQNIKALWLSCLSRMNHCNSEICKTKHQINTMRDHLQVSVQTGLWALKSTEAADLLSLLLSRINFCTAFTDDAIMLAVKPCG